MAIANQFGAQIAHSKPRDSGASPLSRVDLTRVLVFVYSHQRKIIYPGVCLLSSRMFTSYSQRFEH